MALQRSCGLIGCGTVGSGVVRLWDEPGQSPGVPLRAVAVRHPAKPRDVDLGDVVLSGDALALVRDAAIGVIVEATGDAALGHRLALECFRLGKSFVTAGKELVARHGVELEERAHAAGVAFRYEAAAGGAVPVVALLRLGLSPGRVHGFEGVLNGTCNFILSRLDHGLEFAEALEQARVLGFAEADSRKDTSGQDTAEKLLILARLCGVALDPDAVSVRGIEGLGPDDAAFGRRRGLSARLVAAFRDDGRTTFASVAPAFVPRGSFLAQARDEENAVVLDAGHGGVLGLVGRGAGSLPTAAALLADVREVLRRGPEAPVWRARRPASILAEDPAPARYYVRVDGAGEPARDLVTALDAAGLAVDVLACPRPGRVQAVTAPAEASVVQRALASIAAHDTLLVAINDRDPMSARPVAARAGSAGGEDAVLEPPVVAARDKAVSPDQAPLTV